MKVLSFLNKHLEELFAAVILAAMTLIIFAQIILRIAGLPLSWTEEIGRYMFIWLIYLGCAGAIRKRKHICVDLIDLFLKERGQFIISILSNLIFLIFAIILTVNAIPVVGRVTAQLSPAIRMSMAIPYSAILVGAVLMVLRLIQDTYARIQERKEALKAHE